MKIVIHPDFASLRPAVCNIVEGNYVPEHVYTKRRNTVERVLMPDGSRVVVKRYKCPNALNRWVYGVMRKSKARRAYEYAVRLRGLGVDTPRPVAYVEQRHKGAFTFSWFVSAHTGGEPFSDYYAQMRMLAAERDDAAKAQIPVLRKALIDFVVSLEQKHVRPGDFNHDNILVTQTPDGYHFALVDINRFHFDTESTLHGTMTMFSQFCRSYQDGVDFVSVYAETKGLDFDQCMHVFAQRRNHLLQRKKRKQLSHRLTRSNKL